MRITRNLLRTLQQLRKPDEVRRLWADSICINQEDAEENGQQVAIMGQIYSQASCVLISFGQDPDGHSPKVASLLGDVESILQDGVAKLESLDRNAFPTRPNSTATYLLSHERWRYFHAFLEQPWFDGGWVVREAGLARRGLIVWGTSEITWQSPMWTSSWIFGRSDTLPFLPVGYGYRRLGTHLDAFIERHLSVLRVFLDRSQWHPTTFLICSKSKITSLQRQA